MIEQFVLTPNQQPKMIITNNVVHPVRHNPMSGQLLYRRYLKEIDKTITFRVVNPELDLEIFHKWQNLTWVADFWELNKSKNELLTYLQNGLRDPHQIPAIMELDGKPCGYFEFYWVKEDRLGPYYESSDYDQGFHFLIGEREALGSKSTSAIINSNIHYLFMRESRTQRVMAEPRSDNNKVLRYMGNHWHKLKEFDFPHKHAFLLECTRERFFNEVEL